MPIPHPRRALAALALLVAVVATGGATDWSAAGRVRPVKRNDPAFDRFVSGISATQQDWMRQHIWRMSVFSSFFDDKTAWYAGTWAYFDSYAIYNPSPFADQHPDWILRDAAGRKLFIDWGWTGSSYPQYAADIADPGFRGWWIGEAKRLLTLGYHGLWIDDVNLEWRIAGPDGKPAIPVDRATGAPMTLAAWRTYFAEFMEQVRRELPGAEILHNAIWFAGGDARDDDPLVQREIASADWLNLEHGVNDDGLTGGDGIWSLSTFLAHVDRVHATGRGVVLDDFGTTDAQREYALAASLLTATARDGLGVGDADPEHWYAGYDLDLGAALTARSAWNGLLRRDFAGGLVLLNGPGAASVTVALPGTFTTVDGRSVTSVTLDAKRGAVLRGQPPATVAGGLLREWWTGIPGRTVAELTASPRFAGPPTGSERLAGGEAPRDWADDYGQRLRGYLTAPLTGDYVLWIAADDTAELWLAPSAAPGDRRLVASVPAWTGPREWTKYAAQRSAAIRLTAGGRYYLEVLHKEGGGLDNLAIGWDLPDGSSERPIPAARLTPFDPSHAALRSPHGGAHAIPGTVQAEDFDDGGEGVAYHDADAANDGGGYRATAVDIRGCSDAGGGWQVGWFGAGEWLEYTVSVAAAGRYDVGVRVATGSAGGSVRVAIDGVDASGALAFGTTGGYDTWTTLTRRAVPIAVGSHVVRLSCERGNLDCNWISFSAAGPVSGQWYQVMAEHSHELLAVSGSSTADAAAVWQWHDDGTSGEQWRIDALADGSYTFTARCSGKVLDMGGWSTADGGRCLQWPLHGGANQRWLLADTGGGWYRVTNVNSGKVLDVAGMSIADGAPVQQWADLGGANQRWALVPIAPAALAQHAGAGAGAGAGASGAEGADGAACGAAHDGLALAGRAAAGWAPWTGDFLATP